LSHLVDKRLRIKVLPSLTIHLLVSSKCYRWCDGNQQRSPIISFFQSLLPIMFYLKTLKHDIALERVHPFGPELHATVVALLKKEVEGLALAKYGYVIKVQEVAEDQIPSEITTAAPAANDNNVPSRMVVTVTYKALLLRPFINEVVDAVVWKCNPLGFLAFVGPMSIYVNQHSMPEDMENGYDAEKEAFISCDGMIVISSGCSVRLRIKSRTVEKGNVTANGAFQDDYLGMNADPVEGWWDDA